MGVSGLCSGLTIAGKISFARSILLAGRRFGSALAPHDNIGECIELLLDMKHPLFVISEGLGVFFDALARALLKMGLHQHGVFEVLELTPDAFQRGIYPHIP